MKKFICKYFGHSWGNDNAINALLIMAAIEVKNNLSESTLLAECERCGAKRDLKQEIIEAILKRRNKK